MTTDHAIATIPTRRLVDEIDEMHAFYVRAINDAVAADRDDRIEELVAAYDHDVVHLVAEREGRLDQLHLFDQAPRPSRLSRMFSHLRPRATV